jgi:hypothetical protein
MADEQFREKKGSLPLRSTSDGAQRSALADML